MTLSEYLNGGGYAVIQTAYRRLYLIGENDYSDFPKGQNIIDDFSTIGEFLKKGVIAWEAVNLIAKNMPLSTKRFLAAYTILKNRPVTRAELCKFPSDCFDYCLNDIVIVALHMGQRKKKIPIDDYL